MTGDLSINVKLTGDTGENFARMRAALRIAEAFIADELEVRQQSYLPDATEGEQDYIGDAEQALKAVRDALEEGQ